MKVYSWQSFRGTKHCELVSQATGKWPLVKYTLGPWHFGTRCHSPERQSPRWAPWVTRIIQPTFSVPLYNKCTVPGCWMRTVPKHSAMSQVSTPPVIWPQQFLVPTETPWRDVKISSWGPAQAGRLNSCFLDQPRPGSAAGPQKGLRCKGTCGRLAHFPRQDNKRGADRPRFSLTGQITLTVKLFSEPSKSQIWSASQSKNNRFQQPAAQAGEIQWESPPSSHPPEQYPKNPPGVSKQKFSGILWGLGVIFLHTESTQSIFFHNQGYIPLWNSLLWRSLKMKYSSIICNSFKHKPIYWQSQGFLTAPPPMKTTRSRLSQVVSISGSL